MLIWWSVTKTKQKVIPARAGAGKLGIFKRSEGRALKDSRVAAGGCVKPPVVSRLFCVRKSNGTLGAVLPLLTHVIGGGDSLPKFYLTDRTRGKQPDFREVTANESS